MRSQCEKNKEALLEEIEKYSEMPLSDSVAEHLSVYHGALKALYMLGKEYAVESAQEAPAARTAELDGDTEFEKVILAMPFDMPHAKAVVSVLADHMESLAVMNKRAYDNVMARLKGIAK